MSQSPDVGTFNNICLRSDTKDPGRYAANDGSIRHILHYDGICPNNDIISDVNRPQNFCTSAYVHAIAQHRSAKGICLATVSDSDPVAYEAIVADDGGSMNDDAAMMLDHESSSDLGCRSQRDSASDLDELAEQRRNDSPRNAYDRAAIFQSCMAEAVDQNCPESKRQDSLTLGTKIFRNPHGTASLT